MRFSDPEYALYNLKMLHEIYHWAQRGTVNRLGDAGLLNYGRDKEQIHKALLSSPTGGLTTDTNKVHFSEISSSFRPLVIDYFKTVLESSHIGRFIFYLIKGGQSIPGQEDCYFSPLPKLLYPQNCMSAYCHNTLILKAQPKAFLKRLKSYSTGKLLCKSSKCRSGWDDWRQSIEQAINIAYEFPRKSVDSKTELAILSSGIGALADYLFHKESYQPCALLLSPIKNCLSAEDLANNLILPDHLNQMYDFAGGFKQKDKPRYAEWDIRLPAELFDPGLIKPSNSFLVFKRIGVVQNTPGDAIEDDAVPIIDGKNAEEDWVLLKDLGRLLRTDIENMFEF
jgi:hypothetical protein